MQYSQFWANNALIYLSIDISSIALVENSISSEAQKNWRHESVGGNIQIGGTT